MPVISLVQGSDNWLAYRKERVMATDTPVLLGSTPWKEKLQLWKEKQGLVPATEMNDAMRRGIMLELPARELASIQLNMEFNPMVYESDEFPWLAASLDGISSCREYILEIKSPKESTHMNAIEQIIPEYYIDQMQHQLLVTQAKHCFYVSYRPEYRECPLVIIEIKPNIEKQLEIIEKGHEFYIQMCTMNAPEEWKFKERK